MTLAEKSCIICDGKGFYDIHYMNWRKKSETLPCPWCYSERKPLINLIVEMSKIWRNAWSNFIQYHYMANPSTPEEKEYIDQNFFCKNVRHNYFRVAVLETAKLINHTGPLLLQKYVQTHNVLPRLKEKTNVTFIQLQS